MARNIHANLWYEKDALTKRMYQIRIMSDMMYDLDSIFSKSRQENVIQTWSGGIGFTDLTKDEYRHVRTVLRKYGHGKLQKMSNSDGITLSGNFAESEVERRTASGLRPLKVWCTVEFVWGLPDSCEVTYEETFRIADAERFFIKGGVIHEKNVEAKVECSKPVMEAVFDAPLA